MEYQRATSESHLLTFGMDAKKSEDGASSKKLFDQQGLKQDDLTFSSFGMFAQSTWFVDPSNELSAVLRLEKSGLIGLI